jgi:hypothetical protein
MRNILWPGYVGRHNSSSDPDKYGRYVSSVRSLCVRTRPGNVHDSNDAIDFILAALHEIPAILPRDVAEPSMDTAHQIFDSLAVLGKGLIRLPVNVLVFHAEF